MNAKRSDSIHSHNAPLKGEPSPAKGGQIHETSYFPASYCRSCVIPCALFAQDKYPSKPITLICPYRAGGSADNRSRQIGKLMSQMLGQPITIDNKAGAGGNIGTEAIAKAKPDGYTIGMGNFAPLAVNHALFKKLNFDPINDLVPIILIERGPLILTVRTDSPFKTVADIVKAAKASPGKLSYASGGIGGTSPERCAVRASRRNRHDSCAVQERLCRSHRPAWRSGANDV